MYSISQFSKLTRLSPRMLRHYDKIGLLKPQTIDSMNNYRYYSDSQVSTAMEIVKLKKYDFSLEEIKDILTNDDIFLKKMVKEKINLINKSVRAKTDILEEMEMYLKKGIESIKDMNTYSILYGTAQEQYVIKKRASISIHEMDKTIDELYDYALKNNLYTFNTPFTNFLSEDFNEENLNVEFFVPIKVNSASTFDEKNFLAEIRKDDSNIEIHKIPSHTIVSTIHIGSYENIGLAYYAIEKWISESNFNPTGFTYEIYLRSTESLVSEKDFVTQICYEVD
ncbi:MerR family transcriptional regulator [Tepidibacter hydrothermalis]|uniref:MerR family transcriptional regulator n=1 Tax=Tepidibacter hydrothermalis TaxID=3036126 RepID=A0ABY8EFR3_9FIRM|nr:MerR family transcriptional regulator [Tepidibacter hydrothermalis]WFD11795.1 MerR family transcriptional regulator [Tepidibacter hydrothermalis]